MIEIVYKENKEQANGNEGYFHLPKNIRQVGDTNGRERIYLEDYVGTFLKKYFSAPEGRAAMLFGEFKWADGISYFFIRSAAAIHTMEPAPDHLVFDGGPRCDGKIFQKPADPRLGTFSSGIRGGSE
jgi:hypothetical protein